MSKPSKKEITLKMLAEAGPSGVSNREFNNAGIFRYSARIQELRDAGYNIRTVRQKAGLFRFRLEESGTPPAPLEPRADLGAATPQQETEPAGGGSTPPADPLPLFEPEPLIRSGFGHQDIDQRAA